MAHSVPRFSNPHLLPESSQIISRETEESDDIDLELVQTLNEHLQNTLDTSVAYTTQAPREEPAAAPPSEFIFKLWSTPNGPQSIKLSKPVVNHVAQRPKRQCEDTKHERKERRRRAKAIALDFEAILASAAIHPPHHCRKEIIEEKLSTLTSFPQYMVFEQLRPLRQTRPPVAASQLKYHPYAPNGLINPSESTRTKLPIIDLHSPPSPKRPRTRHRRKKRTSSLS